MKKMKKIVFFVVLAICLCVTCFIIFENHNKKTGYQTPINGIEWGMTSDEVLKKLNLSQDNVSKNKNGNIIVSYENTSVFNQKANIKMLFDLESEINLSEIQIDFPDLNKDDLINQLNNTYGQYVKVENDQFPVWKSEKVMDLPQKNQERLKYVKIELPQKYNISAGFSEDGMWKELQQQPLVSIQLYDSTLRYDAKNMAAYTIVSNDKKYDAWVEFMESLFKNSSKKGT